MIIGSHAIVYSRNAEKDRTFVRDMLGFPHADAGGGWLIFGLPPSELAFHPGFSGKHEFYLMCEDVEAFAARMAKVGARCGPRKNQGWGILTELTLPSGTRLPVYQPLHARPAAAPARKAAVKKRAAKNESARPATKTAAKPVKKAAPGKRKKPARR